MSCLIVNTSFLFEPKVAKRARIADSDVNYLVKSLSSLLGASERRSKLL